MLHQAIFHAILKCNSGIRRCYLKSGRREIMLAYSEMYKGFVDVKLNKCVFISFATFARISIKKTLNFCSIEQCAQNVEYIFLIPVQCFLFFPQKSPGFVSPAKQVEGGEGRSKMGAEICLFRA